MKRKGHWTSLIWPLFGFYVAYEGLPLKFWETVNNPKAGS